MKPKSAAQRAVDYFEQDFEGRKVWSYVYPERKKIAARLRAEDRQRVRMERAILAWWKSGDFCGSRQSLAHIAAQIEKRDRRKK